MVALAPHNRFLAELRTSFNIARLMFAFKRGDVESNLSVQDAGDGVVVPANHLKRDFPTSLPIAGVGQ